MVGNLNEKNSSHDCLGWADCHRSRAEAPSPHFDGYSNTLYLLEVLPRYFLSIATWIYHQHLLRTMVISSVIL